MARNIKINQIDEEEQLLARLAWACEVEGLTQSEAADRFRITRLRVNKALSDARKRGILRVNIDSVYAVSSELEWKLERKFRLLRAVVVPTHPDTTNVTQLVSSGLGAHLSSLMSENGIRSFGMSWGNTLNLATRFMQPLNRPDLEIISIMGGVARGSDVNAYEITTRFADLCNAEHSFFTMPLYAGSAKSRDLFLQQDVIVEMLEKICACDAIALAAGDLKSSLLVRDALPNDICPNELISKGGVGDITGHVLNIKGDQIDHEINQRVIGISLDEMEKIENVILAAGGQHKVPIIFASLSRGFIDTLVTDEQTASAILKLKDNEKFN